ncbi:hypothetical protein C8R47DRAFT_1063878 [Mycena vitilis]|nr:hypothetical protein C8R47DRAFT_1063878 [Mycena vitilis]
MPARVRTYRSNVRRIGQGYAELTKSNKRVGTDLHRRPRGAYDQEPNQDAMQVKRTRERDRWPNNKMRYVGEGALRTARRTSLHCQHRQDSLGGRKQRRERKSQIGTRVGEQATLGDEADRLIITVDSFCETACHISGSEVVGLLEEPFKQRSAKSPSEIISAGAETIKIGGKRTNPSSRPKRRENPVLCRQRAYGNTSPDQPLAQNYRGASE